ncbi:FeoB small GTPase domain-containing protein [Nitrosopumilus sp.]|uniref:FeoB small GTPase domain-containing protein n=1 Tax=Nitrosopumilus sp. TaxID=2024843 RepID=UPI002617A465|nr:FeoB small GTPase domain-containing protein [Nitrosopumilus sp.]
MTYNEYFQFAVIGKEGVGKSQLISSLTGKYAESSNLKGSTVSRESYNKDEYTFIDTPGIVFDSDSETTKIAISSMQGNDTILLVARATNIDDDLEYFLPLIKNKKGVIIATNWDRVNSKNAATKLENLEQDLKVPIIPVDARRITESQKSKIFDALENPRTFSNKTFHTGISIKPKPTVLEKEHMGILIGLALLLSPSILSVIGANYFADFVHPIISNLLTVPIEYLNTLPSPLRDILAGDYGFVSMGPFLFVWAAPVVVIYAVLLGIYKATGLLDRTSLAIHPLVKRIGVSGRDVTRIVMGFGCNVPAVISSRSCSSCSRGSTVSAISFGSACSYQFGSSIAVFAAAGMPWLVTPFLLYLTGTTILYTRLVSRKENRLKLNMPVIEGQVFFERPSFSSIWRESKSNISQFFKMALPIFFAITFVASIIDWIGIIDYFANEIGFLMQFFNLPEDSALAIIFGSIRKDGLLLLAEPSLVNSLSAIQILTAVYLAGTLLPCIVTFLTVIREMSWIFALKMIGKQVVAVTAFTLLLAHSDKILKLGGI